MNRFDRALAILLLLRSGKTWSAPNLARRLEVSTRTIYRDIETLSAVGVPVYAEAGREGGYRLVEGYFLPPIAFTVGEATSLLTGLALLDRLHAKPFAAELDTAAHKLLAVVPSSLQNVLSQAQRVIGFEAIPEDIFHPERTRAPGMHDPASSRADHLAEAQAITVFLKCIFDQQAVEFAYTSPYGRARETQIVAPYGILWDRDRWYLIGRRLASCGEPRLWRADRVVTIAPSPQHVAYSEAFTTDHLLDRQWLDAAMAKWAEMAPVVIRMAHTQAERLKRDWYYAHAHFEDLSTGKLLMTFGENNREFVFELLRWLGPAAELIEPQAWRTAFADELRAMLQSYET
jgi:predicted DNA-binding transcriptional regulator YafY